MIGLLVALQIVVHAPPPPPPAEAVRILLALPSLTNVATWAPLPPTGGPRIAVAGYQGPPALPEPTRLDGTPLWMPPAQYGMPNWLWGAPFWSLAPGCQNCNPADSGHIPPVR